MSVGSQYYAGAVATGPGLPLEISRTKDATCLGCILTPRNVALQNDETI